MAAVACKSDRNGDRTSTIAAPADAMGSPRAANAADAADAVVLASAPPVASAPLGLPSTPSPRDNESTPDKVALGQLLFFDPRLSGNGSVACASCHNPDKGWSDGVARGKTASGSINVRNTASLYNVAYAEQLAWDGSAASIERHLEAHWPSQQAALVPKIIARLSGLPEYRAQFRRAFSAPVNPRALVQALAAFVRTIRSGGSMWDEYEANPSIGMTADVQAGFDVFTSRAGCATCHTPPLYTDHKFYPASVAPQPGEPPDPGRARVTGNPADEGKFRTPTLRGALYSAPYFHDGRADDLDAAIEQELARTQIELSSRERLQLKLFVSALSPAKLSLHPRPALPADP